MASRAASPLALFTSPPPIEGAAHVDGKLGVADSREEGSDILLSSELVNLMMKNEVKNVKMYDVDHLLFSAFANSGISLVVTLPNHQLTSAATDQSFADDWVSTNISPFYPATYITIIAVGNEVIKQRPELNAALVPAMRNLHTSLQKLNLDGAIKITSPFPCDSLSSWYPPSEGSFKSDLIGPVMKPLLDFLEETSSFFMVDIDIVFDSSNEGITDPNTGEHYSNLLDALIDAFYSAILSAGGKTPTPGRIRDDSSSRVVVTATGWETLPNPRRATVKKFEVTGPDAVAATSEIKGSIDTEAIDTIARRVLYDGGTSLMLEEELQVYIDIFSLLKKDVKTGFIGERSSVVEGG